MRAFKLFAVLSLFAAVSAVGPIVKLAVMDESQFPSPQEGALLYGSDAGGVYLTGKSAAWDRIRGTVSSRYGFDFGPFKYCIRSVVGGNPTNQGLGATWGYTTATTIPTPANGLFNVDAGLIGQLANYRIQSSAGTDRNANYRSTVDLVWRGDSTNEGGFATWQRVIFNSENGTTYKYVGLQDDPSNLTCPTTLANLLDAIYVGCEAGSTGNYQVCSNDNSGAATCVDLGASFPCQTIPTLLDVIFKAQPNASSIDYEVVNLINEATASGTLSSNLPRNSVFLAMQGAMCTGADGGTATLGLVAACVTFP